VVANVPVRRGTPASRWRDHAQNWQHLDAVNLCLGGHSALDLYRLRFTDPSQVQRFLRSSLADADDPFDQARLAHLHGAALGYLRRQFGHRLPEDIAAPERIEDLFLAASEDSSFPRRRMMACALLKVMHLVDHLEARDLGSQLSITDRELAEPVLEGLIEGATRAQHAGAPIVSAEGGRKSRDAELTKLLLRKDSASPIFDRVRFRMVTETPDDIVPVLAWMLRDHVPFNQILARESVNNLASLREWLDGSSGPRDLVAQLQLPPADDDVSARAINSFSATGFQIVNFVIEAPVRADRLASQAGRTFDPAVGRILYVPAELQLVDYVTSLRNNEGECAHNRYKDRQRESADRRLRWGAVAFPRRVSLDIDE
jgi:uncharacterized protein (TIGR04552 family)